MEIIDDLESWTRCRERAVAAGDSVGFVPTMGALHAGHLSLVARARSETDLVVVSIFVNSTQFNEAGDFTGYPRELESDIAKLPANDVDVLLTPHHEDIYRDAYRYRLTEHDLATQMEGAHRPGHFDGVLTVVMKLLCLVRPRRAYFGEKDYQQYRLIEGMAEAFFLPTAIVACPTIREPDGLACSSRNQRLSAEARKRAPQLYHLLRDSESAEAAELSLESAGFEVEYVCDRDGRRFAAIRLDGIRLIDNVPISG